MMKKISVVVPYLFDALLAMSWILWGLAPHEWESMQLLLSSFDERMFMKYWMRDTPCLTPTTTDKLEVEPCSRFNTSLAIQSCSYGTCFGSANFFTEIPARKSPAVAGDSVTIDPCVLLHLSCHLPINLVGERWSIVQSCSHCGPRRRTWLRNVFNHQ